MTLELWLAWVSVCVIVFGGLLALINHYERKD